MSEARKYRLVLAGLANQYVGQLSQPVRESIFGNVGTMLTFRLGVNDARTLEKEMGVFTAEEILNLDVGEAIARAGGSKTAFNLQTSPPPDAPEYDPTSRIVQMSRQKYARHVCEIDEHVYTFQKTEQAMSTETNSNQRQNKKNRRKTKKKPPKRRSDDIEPIDPSEDDLVT